MKKIIRLHRNNSGWLATFKDDPETVELFGTDTIPTSFTKEARKSDVVREIQKLNPDCIIEAWGNEQLGGHSEGYTREQVRRNWGALGV